MTAPRLIQIGYGAWSSDDPGYHLHDAHVMDNDQDEFTISFTVVLQALTSASLNTLIQDLEAALGSENQPVQVSYDSGSVVPTRFAAPEPGPGGFYTAQDTRCSWRLIGTHRTKLSRAYSVQIAGNKPATQVGKEGKRDQRFSFSRSLNGTRQLGVVVTFTPFEDKDAFVVSEDAALGFDAVATDFLQSKLGVATPGDWESSGKRIERGPSDRTVVVSQTFTELAANQAIGVLNAPELKQVSFGVETDRESGLGYPGVNAVPLAAVTVRFSSVVDLSLTNDLNGMIENVVLPRIRQELVLTLRLNGVPIEASNRLLASPSSNTISGEVDFFVAESGDVIEAAKQTVDEEDESKTFWAVRGEDDLEFDEQRGNRNYTRLVVIALRTVGIGTARIEALAAAEITAQQAAGYVLTRKTKPVSVQTSSAFGAGNSFSQTIATQSLFLKRANIRDTVLVPGRSVI